jgi:plasmid stabilization system protein ParE
MGYSVIVMPAAHADLDDYAAFISRDSERRASEWLMKAWDVIFSLADSPKRFAVIPEAKELGEEVRDGPPHRRPVRSMKCLTVTIGTP